MDPDDRQARASHETIYAMISAPNPAAGSRRRWSRPCGRAGTGVASAGGSGGGSGGWGRQRHRPGNIENHSPAREGERPADPGPLGGRHDQGRSSVGTLVERKTRFVPLARGEGNGAAAVLERFTHQMKRLPAVLRRSLRLGLGLTYTGASRWPATPNWRAAGRSTSGFATPTICDPYAPWQHGSNQNTNGPPRASSFRRGLICSSSPSAISTASPS